MVGMSSVLPPARRVSGVRPVQSVRGPARQKSRPQQPEATGHGPGPERTGRRDRDQIDGEPYIDAEFVEVLREAASAVTIIGPIDGTLRQALEAYSRAGNVRSILGLVIDIPT